MPPQADARAPKIARAAVFGAPSRTRLLGRTLPGRRTPFAAIIFTTAIAVVLISTGDLSTLADTTVVLLLTGFTIVNVAVLVLRRESVEHEHFHAHRCSPCWAR
jgi:APA family basic amino acid/polyamine antiporter